MEIVIGILGIALVILTGWVLARQGHPEEASRDEHGGGGYPSGARPAGPGAESQDPEGRGS